MGGRATGSIPPHAPDMDKVLHEQRLLGSTKRLHQIELKALPDAAMILIDEMPHALRKGMAYPWHFTGYGAAVPCPTGIVPVLTPPAILSCLAHGYQPR
jgi:hypothetical protein